MISKLTFELPVLVRLKEPELPSITKALSMLTGKTVRYSQIMSDESSDTFGLIYVGQPPRKATLNSFRGLILYWEKSIKRNTAYCAATILKHHRPGYILPPLSDIFPTKK